MNFLQTNPRAEDNFDFVVVELVNGSLRVAYDSLVSPTSTVFTDQDYSDGAFHSLSLSISSRLTVVVNGVSRVLVSSPNGEVNIGSGYFIAGIDMPTATAMHLLSSTNSLIGCIANFTVNQKAVSLDNLSSGPVRPAIGCSRSSGCAQPSTCQQGGACVDEWYSTSCRCRGGTSGPTCQNVVSVSFNGKKCVFSFFA